MCELYYHCSWGLEAYKAAKKSHEPLRQKKKYILRNSERNNINTIRRIILEDSSLHYLDIDHKMHTLINKRRNQSTGKVKNIVLGSQVNRQYIKILLPTDIFHGHCATVL